MKRACLALVVGCFLGAGGPTPALAWQALDNCGGTYTHWEGSPSTLWRYAENYPSGDFSEAQTLQVIADSFDEWGVPGCSDFSASQGANTTADPMDWGVNQGVGFYEDWWPASLGSGVLAVTFPSWDWNCGMTFASMVVNGYSWTWVQGGGGNDLQSVVTHEVGHWVGLDHSNWSSSTMTAYYGGGTGDRILSCDDTAAACALYPSGGTACGAPGNSEYCPCGQSCLGGWCEGVESGDSWSSDGGEGELPGDDDDDAPPNDGCTGPPELYSESEPNDWDGETDYDDLQGSGGDITIDATISCGNNGDTWTSDVDWFVVELPCSDDTRFTLDWSGGTSDLDFWVYGEDTELLLYNMDEDYSGPVVEQAPAGNLVYVAVACWGGPDQSYSFEIDFFPWGYTPPPEDEPVGDDDDASPGDDPGDDDTAEEDSEDSPPGEELPPGGDLGGEEGGAEPPGADVRTLGTGCGCGSSFVVGAPAARRAGLGLFLSFLVATLLRRRSKARGARQEAACRSSAVPPD